MPAEISLQKHDSEARSYTPPHKIQFDIMMPTIAT